MTRLLGRFAIAQERAKLAAQTVVRGPDRAVPFAQGGGNLGVGQLLFE